MSSKAKKEKRKLKKSMKLDAQKQVVQPVEPTEEELADLELDIEDAEELLDDEPDTEEVQDAKEYYDGYPISPSAGATSFEQLDENRKTAERMSEVRQVLFDAEQLTGNILRDHMMEHDEKASAIRMVADGFQARINKQLPSKAKEFDFNVAELQMLSQHADSSIGTQATDLFERMQLTKAAQDALPDESYALVVERDGKKVRKYLINDEAQVKNTLAVAARHIEKGGADAADAKLALSAIRTAAKKLGLGAPSAKNQNALVVLKDKKGEYRWFGWVSNNFKDRDGQIITEEAHKDYVGWLDEHPQFAPTFRIWHTPGTDRQKQADFWEYDNGFLMMSGPLTEKEAFALAKVAAKEKLGMSHGFYGTIKDEKYITYYRSFEVSDLPIAKAANPWTPLGVIEKEKEMKPEKASYLAAQLGDDFVKAVEADAATKQANLRADEVEEKEAKPETEAKPEAEGKPETEAKEAKAPDMVAILEAVSKEYALPELSDWVKDAKANIEKIAALEKQVAELKKSDDTKIAEAITPPVVKSHFAWAKRASASDETVKEEAEEKDELTKEGEHWFSEVASQPA